MRTQEVIGILISLTAVSSYINYKFTKLPKSIGITLITLTLSLLVAVCGKFGWNVDSFAKHLLEGIGFDETFLQGMLSFLLFAGALHVNAMELVKYKSLVALLATVSVFISTFLIGYAMFILTHVLGIYIPLYYCFVFGALISPTDPIAVMGVLRNSNAPKALEVKIAGEALFNDGMGIVLFVIMLAIATGKQEEFSAKIITLYFVRQGIGGLLLGCTMGWLAAKLLKTIDDYEVAIILTLAIVTGGYTLAHSVADVSGPICMAIAGLVLASSLKDGNMSKHTMARLDAFWELLDEVLNAILFVLIGLEFLRITFNYHTAIAAIGAIIIVMSARWISVVIPVASLSRFRKFNFDVLMMMTWGGLRGGISIALALSIHSPQRSFIVAVTYAVVLFSMMVQGVTIGPLIRKIRNKENEKHTEGLEGPK